MHVLVYRSRFHLSRKSRMMRVMQVARRASRARSDSLRISGSISSTFLDKSLGFRAWD